MNPKRLSYLQAGWKFLDLQPPADPPPEGKEYRISGYTETPTDIRPIFKPVPVVSPPRTFSKLRLINALMSRDLWPAVRDWLDSSGYYDLFVAQPLAAPSGFALRAQATRPLRGGCIAQDFREDPPAVCRRPHRRPHPLLPPRIRNHRAPRRCRFHIKVQ